MALAHLTDEQIRTWTREQKDKWWLTSVYRGNLPQLSFRAAFTGFILGGVLSATNLYIGAKTGVSLGVGLTSVILAFALFRGLATMGFRDFTILENNALQSIATSAGYVTTPLISSLAAYMLVANVIVPPWQMFVWMVVISIIGVLVAFPLKRRFINEEQLPFPEGAACGVVLDALYTSGGGGEGVYKARILGLSAGLAAFWTFVCGDSLMRFIQFTILRMDKWTKMEEPFHFHERLDDYYYKLVEWFPFLWSPKIAGVPLKTLGLRATLDMAMLGVGGLMGIRVATSVFLGAFINFVFYAPIMIQAGDIIPRINADGTTTAIGRAEIVNQWSLWWGVTMMVVGSLVALAGKPEMFTSAFKTLFKKMGTSTAETGNDVLKHIELPLWMSAVGIPIFSALAAYVASSFFGMDWRLALLALPLIFVLSIICTNSMALTSWTPTGSLSKITQFTFGAIDRTNPATNLTTAGMTAEIASNAANLLSDIKPGYMLGAKPRQQAVGHVIGIISGALVAVLIFPILFFHAGPDGVIDPAKMIDDKFAFPAAAQWKGVADIIAKGLKSLPFTAIYSMVVAAVVAAIIEIATIIRKRPFPLSSVSIGLGVVLPPDACFAMWVGALFFWWMGRRHTEKGSPGHHLWVEGMEPICAGLISGAALTGIADQILNVLLYAK